MMVVDSTAQDSGVENDAEQHDKKTEDVVMSDC